MPRISPLLFLVLAGCGAGPEVPRAVSLGATPLAGQITRTPSGTCPAQVPGGWVATVCPDRMTPDFVATLQRALAARGLYSGAVTGRLDAPTRAAIAAWQTPRGVPGEVLSVRAAQELGLIPWLD